MGADPLHSGHIRHLLEASNYGDLIVILNSDDWLIRKKGYKFIKAVTRLSSMHCKVHN